MQERKQEITKIVSPVINGGEDIICVSSSYAEWIHLNLFCSHFAKGDKFSRQKIASLSNVVVTFKIKASFSKGTFFFTPGPKAPGELVRQ